MAEVLHQVFRCEREPHCWRGYVLGDDVSVTAPSLPHARTRLTETLAVRPEPWAWDQAVEYIEHGVSVDVWLREALDTRAAPRARTSRVISAALQDRRLLRNLHELPEHRFGGRVVVSGIGGDSVPWVCDQFENDSALVVATAMDNHRIWWNALVDSEHPSSSPSLDELGLWDPYAVLDDWLTASPTGATVRAPAH